MTDSSKHQVTRRDFVKKGSAGLAAAAAEHAERDTDEQFEQMTEAAGYLQRALTANPTFVTSMYNLASLYLETGRPELAVGAAVDQADRLAHGRADVLDGQTLLVHAVAGFVVMRAAVGSSVGEELADVAAILGSVGSGGQRLLRIVALGEDGDAHFLAGARRQRHHAAHHLVGMTRVDAEVHRHFHRLVELGGRELAQQQAGAGPGTPRPD